MKSVMLSIKPKYCELIADGKKTIEVRKTRPRIVTPFKCYIYCCKNGNFMVKSNKNPALSKNMIGKYGGKVIGEFICDAFGDFEAYDNRFMYYGIAGEWQISDDEVLSYLNGKIGYGWHISNLVIYENPKELSEFYYPPERFCEKELCGGCPYDQGASVTGDYLYDCEWERPIARPPQSWCYAEESKK